jgi:hypothetical protein
LFCWLLVSHLMIIIFDSFFLFSIFFF